MAGKGNRRGIGRDLLGSGILVFGSSMVLNVAGFVFHAVASRKLGVAEYGALYALISLYSLAAMPVLIFAPVIAKFAAEFRALHDERHVRGLAEMIGRTFAIVGVGYIVIAVVFARPFGAFLHVAPWGIVLVGLLSAAGIFTSAARSLAQGTHDFWSFARSTVAEGVGKVAILFAFALSGLTLLKSVVGFLLGLVVGSLLIVVPFVARFKKVDALPVVFDWPRIIQTTWGAAALAATSAIIGFADVVLVKHFFPAHEAGLYSAASLGGKILLYFVGFVPAVLIPHATDRFARGERTRETVWGALAFVAIAGCVGVIAYRLLGIYLLHALVGKEFDAALPLLVSYGIAMALMATTNTLGSYGLSTHRLAFAAPLLLGALGTLAAIAVWHATLATVVAELIAGNVVMLLLVALALSWQGYHTRSDR